MFQDFEKMAEYFDLMYTDEARCKEVAAQVRALAQKYGFADGGRLIELACATGMHSRFLSEYYDVTGIDMCKQLIETARKNAPAAKFLLMDMRDFNFNFDQHFDIAVSFYGSVGFASDWERLRRTLECIWDNLKPGGLLIFTPWIMRESLNEGIYTHSEQKGDFSLCRMETVRLLSKDMAELELHHLVGHKTKIKYYRYTQEFSTWNRQEYLRAIETSGFALVEYLDEKYSHQGAFVCIKEGL